MAHLEMVGTLVRQLAKNATTGQIENSPLAQYFMDHGRGVYPADASGNPWNAATIAVSSDPITDLVEDLAAEQKARATYDNILRFSDDPDVNKVIKFLREREVVHFQRFGEALLHSLNGFLLIPSSLCIALQASPAALYTARIFLVALLRKCVF